MQIAPRSSESSHWYYPDGRPCYEVENKSGGGMRGTTLRDARKLGLLPSVTTILRLLHKPALVDWLISNACLAVLTAPRLADEPLDAFVERVLSTERQQDQEADKARELGTRIHDAMEKCLNFGDFDEDLRPYVLPAYNEILGLGNMIWTERVLVGNGYAGKADLAVEGPYAITILDLKTTKSQLPSKPYPEHVLQAAAYAKALGNTGDKYIHTAILYISTVNPGEMSLCINQDWEQDARAFNHLVQFWYIINNYTKP